MAVMPIGNNSNTYPTVFQSGNTERGGGAQQTGKVDLSPGKCQT